MTTIYKISGYVRWDAKGDVITGSKGGGSYTPPVSSSGLDGSGVTGQVAFWLDENTLISDHGLSYDSTTETLFIANIKGRDADDDSDADSSGAADSQDLTLHAGNSIIGQGLKAGDIYIVPGEGDTYGSIYLGDDNCTNANINIEAKGSGADVSLSFVQKGSGNIAFGNWGTYITNLFAVEYIMLSSALTYIGINDNDAVIAGLNGASNGNSDGLSIRIHGGTGASWGTTHKGGDIFIYGGAPYGAGDEGKVYIGTSSTVGKDVYAHDFILIP
jgi:hypothetical protein